MSSHEDTGSRTEADAQRAEAHRVQVTGEDREVDALTPRHSTWDPANIPQHVRDDIANAPTDVPPFT